MFLLICCKQSDKKVKCFFFSWFVWLLCFLNTKILQISLRIWELVSDQNFLHLGSWISDDFQFLVTLMSSTFYCVSKLKYRNLNSYFHLLILLSGNISLNPGPIHLHKQQCLNKWNIFKSRGIHFIHLNISSLLPKIEELQIIAKSTNAAIIGISESKLDDESGLEPDIQIDDCNILWCDRNRHRGGVACYIRNDLSYSTSVFPHEIESVFFEILLPNSKPITVGTIYCPPNQSNFLKVLNQSMNKIYPISSKISILGNFNINLSLNDSYPVSSKISFLVNFNINLSLNDSYFLKKIC